jgi:hypothetical protein
LVDVALVVGDLLFTPGQLEHSITDSREVTVDQYGSKLRPGRLVEEQAEQFVIEKYVVGDFPEGGDPWR